MDIVDRIATILIEDHVVFVLMNENRELRLKLEQLERVWLSPETYEELMRERQETLHDMAQLKDSREWYKHRCEELQKAQKYMRDPERKAVCDILANGITYVYAETKDQR